jgi:aspartate 1-decarboxylase
MNDRQPPGLTKWVLSSKIQRAVVTRADVRYVGSITLDEDLMGRAGLWPGEKVMVVSNTTGVRLETYVIAGSRGEGGVFMNGPAAHLIKTGEEIIIMGFALSDHPIQAKNILVDRKNRFVRFVLERENETLETLPA